MYMDRDHDELDALLLEAKGEIERLREALKPFADSVLPDDSTASGWRFGYPPSSEDKYRAHRVFYGTPTPVADPKLFTFADPSAQREWERQRKERGE
jgi:hypothetical protein